ncbi:hypothetical protein M426DRAFT_13414 [Hypoxylon sp. CI-4A]|nr:hypothetical protein M426DRAFT_13414 [Hypoxylon sp. CI-4A]
MSFAMFSIRSRDQLLREEYDCPVDKSQFSVISYAKCHNGAATLIQARVKLINKLGVATARHKKLTSVLSSPGNSIFNSSYSYRTTTLPPHRFTPSWKGTVQICARPLEEWKLVDAKDNTLYIRQYMIVRLAIEFLENTYVPPSVFKLGDSIPDTVWQAIGRDLSCLPLKEVRERYFEYIVKNHLDTKGRAKEAEALSTQKHTLEHGNYKQRLRTLLRDCKKESEKAAEAAVSNIAQQKERNHKLYKAHRRFNAERAEPVAPDPNSPAKGPTKYKGIANGASSPLRSVTNSEDLEDPPKEPPTENPWLQGLASKLFTKEIDVQ